MQFQRKITGFVKVRIFTIVFHINGRYKSDIGSIEILNSHHQLIKNFCTYSAYLDCYGLRLWSIITKFVGIIPD